MKFPVAIEPGGKDRAFGVVVPDLPGCFSAGDSIEEAFDLAAEAIGLHLETLVEDGGQIPEPRPLSFWHTHDDFAGWVWGIVEVDTSKYEGKSEKINITLPAQLLERIDRFTRLNGETRSGFLARAAREVISREQR